MPLPYENAQAGDRALGELQKILRNFGCTRFGTMADDERGEMLVQFSHHGLDVTVRTSIRGYAAAWLREHPWTNRMKRSRTEHERKAMEVASVAVCSLARDWIKGQITAVETGLLSFEAAFLGQIMLPNGRTILDEVEHRELLPAPDRED